MSSEGIAVRSEGIFAQNAVCQPTPSSSSSSSDMSTVAAFNGYPKWEMTVAV